MKFLCTRFLRLQHLCLFIIHLLFSISKATILMWPQMHPTNFSVVCYTHVQPVQFICSVVSDSLQPHGLQYARLPCPSLSPRVRPSSCPLDWWWGSTGSKIFCHLWPSSIVSFTWPLLVSTQDHVQHSDLLLLPPTIFFHTECAKCFAISHGHTIGAQRCLWC